MSPNHGHLRSRPWGRFFTDVTSHPTDPRLVPASGSGSGRVVIVVEVVALVVSTKLPLLRRPLLPCVWTQKILSIQHFVTHTKFDLNLTAGVSRLIIQHRNGQPHEKPPPIFDATFRAPSKQLENCQGVDETRDADARKSSASRRVLVGHLWVMRPIRRLIQEHL